MKAEMAKIQKFKDLLGNRWGTDIRVVTCYVHMDGNDICLEIDGRQEKRPISRLENLENGTDKMPQSCDKETPQ